MAGERDEVRVVDDEIVSPTFTVDIANQVVHLVQTSSYGLYHATSQNSSSWHQFAAKIFELTKVNVKLSVAKPEEFPIKVPRPKYSVLENMALQQNNLDIMPHWQDALERYLTMVGRR